MKWEDCAYPMKEHCEKGNCGNCGGVTKEKLDEQNKFIDELIKDGRL